MRKLSTEEKHTILEALAKQLEAPNIVIVFGDHQTGTLDTLMTHAKEVDPANFGINAMGTIQNLLHKLNPEIPLSAV